MMFELLATTHESKRVGRVHKRRRRVVPAVGNEGMEGLQIHRFSDLHVHPAMSKLLGAFEEVASWATVDKKRLRGASTPLLFSPQVAEFQILITHFF